MPMFERAERVPAHVEPVIRDIPPAQAKAQETQSTEHPQRRKATRYDHYAGMAAEVFMLGVAGALWVLNAKFTAEAFLLLQVPILFGYTIAIGITLIEQYLWRQKPDALIITIVGLVLAVDVITSLVGLSPELGRRAPALAEGVDTTNPLTWFSGDLKPFHVVCMVLASVIAIAPEPMVKYFWRRLQAIR